MPGIHVFAFLVGCAPNLIACEQIPTNGLEWAAMPDCRAELPRLVRRNEDRGYPVIMARCQYVLDDGSAGDWRVAGTASRPYYGF
jgi:hypothetical protein